VSEPTNGVQPPDESAAVRPGADGPTPERWAELEARGRAIDERAGAESSVAKLIAETACVAQRNSELEAQLAAAKSPAWDYHVAYSEDTVSRRKLLEGLGRDRWMLCTTVVLPSATGGSVINDTFMRAKP
jgi:hypothetical protein